MKSAPSFHLSENYRQRNCPEDAQAAADLRDGNVDKMLESYLNRGRLTVSPNRERAAQTLVTEWSKDGGAKHPEQAIILTETREEARHINQLCQTERQLDGHVSHKTVRIHGDKYHVGDRVMFHKPNRPKGIENGYQGTITSIHPVTKAVTFRLDREPTEQQRRIGRTQSVTFKLAELKPDFLTLGYAATTHKMQGQSQKRAYCLMGGSLTNQELTYVQITRGEELTKLFVDRDHAGPKLADLVAAVEKSGRKELAHDQGERLKTGTKELKNETGLRLRIQRSEEGDRT